MKKLIFCLGIVLISNLITGQEYLPSSIMSKVFHLKYKDTTGTTFVIDFEGNNFFVTARHVISGVEENQNISIQIFKDNEWRNLTVITHTHPNPLVDIILLEPLDQHHITSSISMKNIEMIFGDEGFFLGFPFGLRNYDTGSINDGFPFPLVKKAVFSGSLAVDSISVLFLDGNNNPGFSGGPIFFKDRIKSGDNKWHLVGVISAYVNQENEIVTPIGNLKYSENSGIIISYSKKHIMEIIKNIRTP